MKPLRIALAVSILLNLFLAGAIVGGAAWVRGRTPMIAAGSLRVAGSELPADERRAFRGALREARRGVRDEARASRAARAEAATELRAPSPDPAAILAALDRARAADLAVRAAVERRAVNFAVGLPAAERARIADAMERRSRPASDGRPRPPR